jgi:hypothetical protein
MGRLNCLGERYQMQMTFRRRQHEARGSKRPADGSSYKLAGRRRRIWSSGVLLVLAVVAFCQVLVPRASGQAVTPYKYVPNDSGDQCLASLPIPSPAPGLHRVLQLVNCSNQSLLGAANAA